ncbi:DMT family transporter [Spirosoma flavus]
MNQALLSWLCLITAGFCQMGWTYSLKLIRFTNLQSFCWSSFSKANLIMIGPWIGYIVFGAVNSFLLSIAMRTIPTATVFIIWMGLSILLIKLCDVFWFKLHWSFSEFFFIGLILVGIIGLKLSVQAD